MGCPIAGGMISPTNLAKIGLDTMLENEFKLNSSSQNWLIRWGLHPTYKL